MLLADHSGELATTVVADCVLDHLDRLDPEGDFLPVPAAQSHCGGQLASVTRLPVMSGMFEAETETRHATPASVIALCAHETGVRPGSGCR
jgi:hypothetical protein